jgi:cytochrome b
MRAFDNSFVSRLHNPAGSLMILGLIATLSVTAITGWMYTLDAFWGEEWVEDLHEATATLMLFMVLIHVVGVIYASRQHQENLVKSMFNGRKRSPEPGDVA